MPASRSAKRPRAKPVAKSASKAAKPARSRMSLRETMRALEAAGTVQARKTYARHGAREPMFGVSFAALKRLVKRIGVDHELALELWDTGNHDARVLAYKLADPARIGRAVLERWARDAHMRMWGGYVAMLAAEGPHGAALARRWFASSDPNLRTAAWVLAGLLASLDERIPDAWFLERLARIEAAIHAAPNAERYAMNNTVIAIGGRNAALRRAATAAARRIGAVDVDHGDTWCKTPDARAHIEKAWAHAASKRFASPAAQERAREPMRTRC